MLADWTTLALAWYGNGAPDASAVDPIFGRPLTFFLFSLPALQLLAGWLTTLAIIIFATAIFFAVVSGGTRLLTRHAASGASSLRGSSIAFAAVLLASALRVYLGRFDRILEDHTIFAGVTYTDAHVMIPGMLWVAFALVLGALIVLVNAVAAPKLRWIVASLVPAIVLYFGVSAVGWYVNGFIVKPNELVRETPVHRAQHRADAHRLCAEPDRAGAVPRRHGHRRRRSGR